MIELRNIRVDFDERPALDNISLSFERGKVNMVIGRSGSGKTVLLKTVVGLIQPQQGTILYEEQDFFAGSTRDRAKIRQQVGMLFQAGALFDSQTVWENVMFPLNVLTTMTRAEKEKRVAWCLERVNLPHAAQLLPGELSGGMMKRVGIARAIALNPRYLFVDEPNSGLDPLTSIVIDELIKEVTREFDMTTIIISHDINSVLEIGDRVFFLHEGKLEWEGSGRELLTSDNELLQNFAFASEYFRQVRDELRKE